MKPNILSVGLLVFVLMASAGCASLKKCGAKCDEKVVYDQVLTYDKPYDYVYMKTLFALNDYPNWLLDETDKEKGIIVLRDIQFGHMFDRDKWLVRVSIKRINIKETSVSLTPETQECPEGGKILDRIDQVMKIVGKGEEAKPAESVPPQPPQ